MESFDTVHILCRYEKEVMSDVVVTDQAAVELNIRLKRSLGAESHKTVRPSFETIGDMIDFVATFANSTRRTPIPGLVEPRSEYCHTTLYHSILCDMLFYLPTLRQVFILYLYLCILYFSFLSPQSPADDCCPAGHHCQVSTDHETDEHW